MLLLQNRVSGRQFHPSRTVLYGVLLIWLVSTAAAMWWLNPVTPASLSVCTAPAA